MQWVPGAAKSRSPELAAWWQLAREDRREVRRRAKQGEPAADPEVARLAVAWAEGEKRRSRGSVWKGTTLYPAIAVFVLLAVVGLISGHHSVIWVAFGVLTGNIAGPLTVVPWVRRRADRVLLANQSAR